MKVGTIEHRDLFCRTFIDGHRAYEPEDFTWPDLAPVFLERLRSLPFWGIAKAMERKAGIMVTAFAQTLDDPVIREAVAVQGVEESRHARIMAYLIERYGLPANDVESPIAEARKDEFVTFGYEECLDFFAGVGLYRLAIDREIFPPALTAIFEHVLFEEARHVTFFVNWYRYEEARAGRDGRVSRHINAAKNYVHSLRELVRSFSGVETTGFAMAAAKDLVGDITPVMFLEAALNENRTMLGRLDRRLVKPALLPGIAAVALTALRALPPRRTVVESKPRAAANGIVRESDVAA